MHILVQCTATSKIDADGIRKIMPTMRGKTLLWCFSLYHEVWIIYLHRIIILTTRNTCMGTLLRLGPWCPSFLTWRKKSSHLVSAPRMSWSWVITNRYGYCHFHMAVLGCQELWPFWSLVKFCCCKFWHHTEEDPLKLWDCNLCVRSRQTKC